MDGVRNVVTEIPVLTRLYEKRGCVDQDDVLVYCPNSLFHVLRTM